MKEFVKGVSLIVCGSLILVLLGVVWLSTVWMMLYPLEHVWNGIMLWTIGFFVCGGVVTSIVGIKIFKLKKLTVVVCVLVAELIGWYMWKRLF